MGSTPIPPTIVLDTSPLQGLFRGGVLGLLVEECRTVAIPTAVEQETRAYRRRVADRTRVPDLDEHAGIHVVPIADEDLAAAGAGPLGAYKGTHRYRWRGRDLERPELEAILVAQAKGATLVIEDEIAVRLAREVGLPVASTASLLSALEEAGRIPSAAERARIILASGYHQEDLVRLAGAGAAGGDAYDPAAVEARWQERWRQDRLHRAGDRPRAPKKYVLEMFPSPSGSMHMGHVRNYLAGDVLARYYRMRGFDVLHPFGWDAMGLPVENAAIEDHRHPAARTAENIRAFKADVVRLGLSYDWDREIDTSDPTYQKWSQWFFLEMHRRGLVYRRVGRVNWCPGCAVVLANEQVTEDGRCERSGDPVVERQMPEWALRITSFADALLSGLDTLKGWPSGITDMQRNWIGRSEEVEVDAQGVERTAVRYHLRDWGISRQRYWGTPIPIVYCPACDPEEKGIGVPEAELPVELPEIDVAEVLTGRGAAPLAKVPGFVRTICPSCGGPARREVETMDAFVDSAWYYARYLSPRDQERPFERADADRWLPVDVYVGGPEHAVLHLLYFRFWTRVMKELGLVAVEEPVTRLLVQGIVNGSDGRKMSKRWGNVVSPRALVDRYGADATRLYVMSAGPLENNLDWSDEPIEGCSRFLGRVWKLSQAHPASRKAEPSAEPCDAAVAIRRLSHGCLKRTTDGLERLSFNTAIAGVMETVKALARTNASQGAGVDAAWDEALRLIAVCLSPFAPHFADEIAERHGAREPLARTSWPEPDPALLVADAPRYAIQIDGELRAVVTAAAGAGRAEVEAAARGAPGVSGALEGREVRTVVFVPGRLLNFVLR
jgi:leucyl-tRNA synthetase